MRVSMLKRGVAIVGCFGMAKVFRCHTVSHAVKCAKTRAYIFRESHLIPIPVRRGHFYDTYVANTHGTVHLFFRHGTNQEHGTVAGDDGNSTQLSVCHAGRGHPAHDTSRIRIG
jgi:hypothetical protein